MKLVEAHQFVAKHFAPESRPADITLQRWMRAGRLPGRKIGRTWYVDEDAFLAGNDDAGVADLVGRVLDGSKLK